MRRKLSVFLLLCSVFAQNVNFFTHHSEPLEINCDQVAEGLVGKVDCEILVKCQNKTQLSLEHPFSGRKMYSTVPYTYDGSKIFIELPCNTKQSVLFTGPSLEAISSNGSLILKNLMNSQFEVRFEIPADDMPGDLPAVVGASLKPFEEKRIVFYTKFNFNTSRDQKSQNVNSTPLNHSQYVVLKPQMNLNIDPCTILALTILGYGLYSSRKKKEELI